MRDIDYSLMLASQGDDLERVEALLDAGAAANVRTFVAKEGPLFRAAASGTGAICTRLIEAGADVNAVDANGETPLVWAVIQGNLDTVQALLAAGACINAGTCGSARVIAYKMMTGSTWPSTSASCYASKEYLAAWRRELVRRAEILRILL